MILKSFWTGEVRRSVFKVEFEVVVIAENAIDTAEMFLHFTSCQRRIDKQTHSNLIKMMKSKPCCDGSHPFSVLIKWIMPSSL